MGGGYFSNAGVFLINALFGLYLFAVMLRFVFQLVRVDARQPLYRGVIKATNPVLAPMRRHIPSIHGVDTASVLLLLVLQLVNTWLVALVLGVSPHVLGLIVVAIAELITKAVWIFMGAILIQIVLSWIAPGTYNPMVDVIDAVARPLVRPARELLPPIGGLDFSPMLAIIALNLVLMLAVAPLRDFGYTLF